MDPGNKNLPQFSKSDQRVAGAASAELQTRITFEKI